MIKPTPHILVLGATGFVGQTVFSYLYSRYPTYGTVRKGDKKHLSLTVETLEKDFVKIRQEMKYISLVINCIGLYKDVSNEKLTYVNALFPHQLETLSKRYNFHLVHISSDAVFGSLQGKVNEKTIPIPDSLYGMSKLLGETTIKNAITIRSSFIGRDYNNKNGLLEYVLANKIMLGYINQTWSGCTTLQFAKLCAMLANERTFKNFRLPSPYIHFAPLPKTTKYKLLKSISATTNLGVVVKKTKGATISRFLDSLYLKKSFMKIFVSSYKKAIEEIV